jgi:RHH-type transcriptional regulator, proline utilization regulon repressor / proline dehydrogenase / delta 1-pyrroline-5-carboxylate dehydrogenase
VQAVIGALHMGNIYVNRNQIGAVVGSQPFGGEGLSGTGPKAGGPHYLARFCATPAPVSTAADTSPPPEAEVQRRLGAQRPPAVALSATDLPGPTGESNRLSAYARDPILCLGPGKGCAADQVKVVRALGGLAVDAAGLDPADLTRLTGFSGAIHWGDARAHGQALAARPGPILPLITGMPDAAHVLLERHVCIDTTASGGNAQLLAEVGQT